MSLLAQWLLSAVALIIVAYVVPGFRVSGIMAALFAALLVGFVNATLGLVLKIVTLPLTVVTLGLFWFIVNALMLLLAAAIAPGFAIDGFGPAFWGGILLSLVNAAFSKLFGKKNEATPR